MFRIKITYHKFLKDIKYTFDEIMIDYCDSNISTVILNLDLISQFLKEHYSFAQFLNKLNK
jgi:hypothetical protein